MDYNGKIREVSLNFDQVYKNLEQAAQGERNWRQEACVLGRILCEMLPGSQIAFACLDGKNGCMQDGAWMSGRDAQLGRFLQEHLEECLRLAGNRDAAACAGGDGSGNPGAVGAAGAAECPADVRRGIQTLLARAEPALSAQMEVLPICMLFGQGVMGLALYARSRARGVWSAQEAGVLTDATNALAALFAGQARCENLAMYGFIFNTVLNSMDTNIYITDVFTDKILFMNQKMKRDFGISRPEGEVCWKVLQKGMKKRCPFCPIQELVENAGNQRVYVWEEISSVTGRSYHNCDRLIRWRDGSVVHLQQSVDITGSKQLTQAANYDELTGLLNRRAGKERLARTLLDCKSRGRLLTVALYDINLLKQVNDNFGHLQGDRAISLIASGVARELGERDFAFRLSGDEFVIAFLDTERPAAKRRMKKILESLAQEEARYALPHSLDFCYGLVEISPEMEISVEEALTRADERMYEQKRNNHIHFTAGRGTARAADGSFDYDRSALYPALAKSTDAYLFVCNMKTGRSRYPRAMAEEFGLPGEVLHNAPAVLSEKIHEHDRAFFLQANQEIADGRADGQCAEYRARNVRGEWVWLRFRGRVEPDANGEPALFAGFITNLGSKNKLDQMTGLLNKYELEEQARRMLAQRPGEPLGLMLLGMDEFRHVNDLYDRAFGDEVLRLTARKLSALLPPGADLYRLDGDEFGVLLYQGGPDALDQLYTSVHQCFKYQQELGGRKYFSALSAGCAVYPGDADNDSDLYKYADYALEASKKLGKNRVTFFSRDLLVHKERALRLTELLRESIENHFEGFSLCYQPQVDAAAGTLTGAEALCRWSCPKYGEVPPVEFIPLLEQSGLILQVGRWIFREAVRQCAAWLEKSPDFVMNVNLSYLQLADPGFLPFMKDTLAREELPAPNLVVELTESYLGQGDSSVRRVFEEIRALGIQIAMDDFGTGYSSLGILKTSPADIVKIDRAFVRDIKKSSFDSTFIRFIVELCHDVGIRVCLEGVETPEQYGIVLPMKLDYIQGYLFGKPQPAQVFENAFLSRPRACLK